MAIFQVEGLADASGEVFPTIPSGKYPVRITLVEDKVTGEKSKNPGRPMLKVSVVLEAGQEHEGHKLNTHIVLPCADMDLDQKTMAVNRIKRLLIACGINTPMNEFDTADLVGQSFLAIVSLKEEGGVKQNNLVDQLPLA